MKAEISDKKIFFQIGTKVEVFDSAFKFLTGYFEKSESVNMLVQRTCESEVHVKLFVRATSDNFWFATNCYLYK